MTGALRINQIETEKLIAYYCQVELARRKKEGLYKGSFAPVTHYFGYQGRCSYPTAFDCSLGSTYGFTAAVLAEAGFTSTCVTARYIKENPSNWRVGGVPLLSMLKSEPKEGYVSTELVVNSEEVNLLGEPYQRMKAIQRKWRTVDYYSNPGPIQFFDESRHLRSITAGLYFRNFTQLNRNIQALCNSLQQECLFIEDQHLLYAALASLKSAQSVIHSLTTVDVVGAGVSEEPDSF